MCQLSLIIKQFNFGNYFIFFVITLSSLFALVLVNVGVVLTLMVIVPLGLLIFFIFSPKKAFIAYLFAYPLSDFLKVPFRMEEKLGMSGLLNLVLIVGILSYLVSDRVKSQRAYQVNSFQIMFSIMMIFSIISSLNASNILSGFRGLILYIAFISIIFFIPKVFSTKRDIITLIVSLILSFFIPMIIGFYELIWASENLRTRYIGKFALRRMNGPYEGSGDVFFGLSIGIILPIMYTICISRKSKLLIFYGFLLSLAVVLTFTRNAIIIVISGILFINIVKGKKLISILLIIFLIILLKFIPLFSEVVENFSIERALYGHRVSTLEGRIHIWYDIIKTLMSSERLFIGIGPRYLTNYYKATFGVYNPGAHNTYLMILTEQGGIALFLYIIILISLIFRLILKFREEKDILILGFAGSLIAILLAGFVDNVFHLHVFRITALVIAVSISFLKSNNAKK